MRCVLQKEIAASCLQFMRQGTPVELTAGLALTSGAVVSLKYCSCDVGPSKTRVKVKLSLVMSLSVCAC